MKTSIHAFCRDHDLPKSSVYRRCQELGINTSGGLSPDDRATLLREFGKAPQLPPVNVDPGSMMVLNPPELPQAYDLAGLRNTEAFTIEDPLALANEFLAVADQIKDAMDQDIQVREQKLEKTRQAKSAIEAKASELKLEKRLYQFQTSGLDKTLSHETAGLQELVKTLHPLGKPEAAQ